MRRASRAQELDLAELVTLKTQVVRRVLDRDRPADRILHLGDALADVLQRRARARERQEVGQVVAAEARPGEVLGDERRLQLADERSERAERGRVDRLGAGERERHAVQRQRVLAPDRVEPRPPRTADAHVVLGMDLEPHGGGAAADGIVVVLGLEAEPGTEGSHELLLGVRPWA